MDEFSADVTWYLVGACEWIVASLLAWLATKTISHKPMTTLTKALLGLSLLCWLIMLVSLIFVIPHESQGSYLDIYANLALANFAAMLLMVAICQLLMVSHLYIGLGFSVFFFIMFCLIGGKGIGDALAPQYLNAQIDYLDYSSLNDGRLIVGLVSGYDFSLNASDTFHAYLAKQGYLQNITPDFHQPLSNPIALNVLIAPYSSYIYLPQEYPFSSHGLRLFYALLACTVTMILSVILAFLFSLVKYNQSSHKS